MHMTRKSLRRFGIGLLLAVLIGVALWAGSGLWLDPGSKNDRTSDLITPTLTTAAVRVFAVAPEESRVDFVAEVRGLDLTGVFPVESGTITLEPVGEHLRVLVELNINVDRVDTGNPAIDRVLRGSMETGNYPVAFYVATSRDLVPVTDKEIMFVLHGDLEVHNVPHSHAMDVTAQLVGSDMWAIATSPLDLGEHGVTFPALIGSTAIDLTAHLQAYETDPDAIPTPSAP